MSDPQVWLITGTSSGFGRRLVSIVLERGDRVVATARSLQTIQDFPQSPNLHLLELDEQVDEAAKVWGRIDVLVNNAGIGLLGLLEECGVDMMTRQFRPNVFGVLDVTNAVLPYMREMVEQRLFQGLGAYASSKAAVQAVRYGAIPGRQPGDPMKAMKFVVDVVRGEGVAVGREWPLYLALGEDAERDIRNKCMMMLKHLDEWQDVIRDVNL
ncbi:hypothetical protein F4604DRAFT_1680714 [Suillus subluteus]|nr:hypothetical protein F4604DRAFT_1680714 [Suillus subluteus]